MDKVQNWMNQAEEDLLWAKASFKEGILRVPVLQHNRQQKNVLRHF